MIEECCHVALHQLKTVNKVMFQCSYGSYMRRRKGPRDSTAHGRAHYPSERRALCIKVQVCAKTLRGSLSVLNSGPRAPAFFRLRASAGGRDIEIIVTVVSGCRVW